MKEILAVLLAIGTACALPSAADAPAGTEQESAASCADEAKSQACRGNGERYTIDSSRTVVTFEVRSLGIFRQRGRFGRSSGSVSLNPRTNEGTFDVVIDARSIQAASAATLQVMRGTGFLNVEKFPEISYKAQRVIFNDGAPIRVEGELTLLGMTHGVPLLVSGYRCTASGDWAQRRCMVDASASFRRSEFGMTGSIPLAGNRVRLNIHAEATPACQCVASAR